MFTVVGSPSHILPTSTSAPVIKDDVGNGALDIRRRNTRSLKNWELSFPGKQELLDPLCGFFDYAQGDTPIWFDGGGTIEVVEPIMVGFGNGTDTDFALPHRYVFVSSVIIYINNAATAAWSPLGDGIIMDKVRFDSAPVNLAQITAKYKRKCKVVLQTDSEWVRERMFRNINLAASSIYTARCVLSEIPY